MAKSIFIKGMEYLIHPLSFFEKLVQTSYNNMKQDHSGRVELIPELTDISRCVLIRSNINSYLNNDAILISRKELAWLIAEYEKDPLPF